MSGLPVCRLCKCAPTISVNREHAMCRNQCPMHMIWFRLDAWQKLMYVPGKIKLEDCEHVAVPLHRAAAYVQGWNDCVDAMSKGE